MKGQNVQTATTNSCFKHLLMIYLLLCHLYRIDFQKIGEIWKEFEKTKKMGQPQASNSNRLEMVAS
jgi:hypothetical protein